MLRAEPTQPVLSEEIAAEDYFYQEIEDEAYSTTPPGEIPIPGTEGQDHASPTPLTKGDGQAGRVGGRAGGCARLPLEGPCEASGDSVPDDHGGGRVWLRV